MVKLTGCRRLALKSMRKPESDSIVHLEHQIADFFDGNLFAVVGASADRTKFGNKVLRLYQQHRLEVVPVNPNARTVEGLRAVGRLSDMVVVPHAISIVTPPSVTEVVVDEAIGLGIQHVWMQPGAESAKAISMCRTTAVNVIHGGPCILVAVGCREN